MASVIAVTAIVPEVQALVVAVSLASSYALSSHGEPACITTPTIHTHVSIVITYSITPLQQSTGESAAVPTLLASLHVAVDLSIDRARFCCTACTSTAINSST
jgi:hypothetical protein